MEWTAAGLVIPGHQVTDLFNGFDEVVVFDEKPRDLTPLPAVFTSDRSLSDDARRRLTDWLQSHGALAAAGDGVGLHTFRRP